MIGGHTSSTTSKTIAKLDSIWFEWSKAGDLIQGRHGHNALFDGTDLIVVGGYVSGAAAKTEKCPIFEGKVTCVEQDPAINNYSYYPELFLVENGYCKEWPSL